MEVRTHGARWIQAIVRRRAFVESTPPARLRRICWSPVSGPTEFWWLVYRWLLVPPA